MFKKIKDRMKKKKDKKKIRKINDATFPSKIEFANNIENEYFEGKVDHINPSYAYIVTTPASDKDIRVKTKDLKFAIHGDFVQVMVTKVAEKNQRREGKVVKIIQRNLKEFVGKIEISKNFSFVRPDKRHIHFDVMVYPKNTNKANNNEKVLVTIDRWHDSKNRSPLGTVTEVLGKAGENEAEIHSIMAEFGLPFRFDKNIEQAAEKIPAFITEEEIKKRKDFRDITTFTVDPHDAKDFDDAISIQKRKNGLYEIGIHIADVSHYVQDNSLLDKEAIERTSSVYLVDRTIPMLPERLSNQLCSLRPMEEKLTFSAVFQLDEKGDVHSKWFGKTVIKSNKRFTYEEAQERIEGLEDAGFSNELQLLNSMAKELRKKRLQHGAMNFETVEVTFKLDKKGKPLEIIPKVRKDAHKMIEEFMLLANKEVATHIFNLKEKEEDKTFIYRVHDDPNPEKLETFSSFAAKFGHKIDLKKNIARSLNNLIETIEGKPEQNLLESLAIRSMAKATYSTEPNKHFGLAFDHYSHFTSPIRRYPDVMTHRLLQHYLKGGGNVESDTYKSICIHASEKEKKAADAERASIKYKQVEYMQTAVGNDFQGIISGITEWGVFVEIIETKCEGMIRITDLPNDFYVFDQKNMRLIGEKNKQMFTLGDKIHVLVAKVSIEKRTIDLEPI